MNQAQLDRTMIDEGVARNRAKVARLRASEQESQTQYGKRLLSATVPRFAKAITEWKAKLELRKAGVKARAYELIKDVDPLVVSLIATKVILDGIGAQRGHVSVVRSVARELQDETRFAWFKKHHKGLWKLLERQLERATSARHRRTVLIRAMNKAGLATKRGQAAQGAEDVFQSWTAADETKVGTILVDLFETSTELVETVLIGAGKKSHYVLQATEKTAEWVRQFNEHVEMLNPVLMPMVEKPQAWSTPFEGGYTGDGLPVMRFVKRSQKDADYTKALIKATESGQLAPVYAAVNALQETPWKVNKPVLDVMDAFWKLGRSLGGLPQSADRPLPPKPADIDTNEEAKRAWKTSAARVHHFNGCLRSLRFSALKTMNLARKFTKAEKFYFPYDVDFRGRVYCEPSFLTPQGTDVARGLLLFADGVVMNDDTDAYWLAVYGANLFGVDKVSFEERVKWTNDNALQITLSARDPLACSWWQDADEPWQFLAWCLEWNAWKQKGPGFMTHLPVCLDGTNNGLQLLAMLTRDLESAKATNVAPGDKPADIYADVARVAAKTMQEDGSDLSTYWLGFGINRKTTKRPVMVTPYGGTFHSCMEYSREWYTEESNARGVEMPDRKVESDRVVHLARHVWDAIESSIDLPKQAMSWLMQCSDIMTAANLPLCWTAPSGFPVKQAYPKTRGVRVETKLGDGLRIQQVLTEELEGTLAPKRQRNGVAPNFVHSCDASALTETVVRCGKLGIRSFAMIHDSYGTHAPRVHEMAAVLRAAFSDLFSPDRLAMFREELQAALTASGSSAVLPKPPSYGKLDVTSVKQSEFFFA